MIHQCTLGTISVSLLNVKTGLQNSMIYRSTPGIQQSRCISEKKGILVQIYLFISGQKLHRLQFKN